MNNPKFQHKGIWYEILIHITDEGDRGRANQLLIDFLHCEKVGDWITIKNRITNGLIWGWLTEIENKKLKG